MNNKFISFLNKKKIKQGGDERNDKVNNINEADKGFVVKNRKLSDEEVNENNENKENNADIKNFLSSFYSTKTQEKPSATTISSNSNVKNNENEAAQEEREEIKAMAKQYYKYLNKKGIAKEMPILMKKQLNIKEMPINKPFNKEENIKEEKYLWFQMKKFPLDSTKEKIKEFLLSIFDTDLHKVKRLKDQSNEFNGIIHIEITNNEEAISKLTSKKHYYEKNKLKIAKIENN